MLLFARDTTRNSYGRVAERGLKKVSVRASQRRMPSDSSLDRLSRESLPTVTMQPIFLGVETVEDKIFWKHYINHFSNVLTVEGEARNAFKDIILQLANQHQGLMHSILALSSK